MKWIIFAIIILLIWKYFEKKSKQKIEKNMEKENNFKITVSVSEDGDIKRETGQIMQIQSGGILLSDKSTFPLALLNCSKELAIRVKKILDDLDYYGTYKQTREIVSILLENNIKCKEVEEYINNFKPQYNGRINSLIKDSNEWTSASEKDRNDLLYTIKKQAYYELDVRPYIDINLLLDDVEIDFINARELSKKYGYEIMRFYLRLADNLDKVRVVQADHRDRERYENLVKVGLALRGMDIDLGLILDNMKLKEINELAKDWNKNFKRKPEAIEFLKDKADAIKKLDRLISFRELFKFIPLPKDFENIKSIQNAFEYYNIVAELISHTYSFGTHAYQRIKEDIGDSTFITGWEISIAGDNSTCNYCKRMAEKKYGKGNYPKTPFHIGCRCSTEPILKY